MGERGERPYQITVFGATGYTGKFVVEELKNRQTKGVSWAVAGRNEEKLKATLRELGCPDVPVVIADVNDVPSMESMCAQTQVIISCVGPFSLYGEPLIKACIASKCDYIDVTGEPYFMELMQQRYHQEAVDAGVHLVSSCGFDSIPNDLGVVFTEQQFKGELQYVESFMKVDQHGQGAAVHTGTWESLLHGVVNVWKVRDVRKEQPRLTGVPKGVRAPKRGTIFHSSEMSSWCLPFPGSDASVVARTQRFLYEHDGKRPLSFKPYLAAGSLLFSVCLTFFAGLTFLLAQIGFMRQVMLKYPRVFSLGFATPEGPTRANLEKTTFSVTLFGHGFKKGSGVEAQDKSRPDSLLVTRVRGPDPGYIGTAHMLVESALTVLREKRSLPLGGGVLTPGTVFAKTKFIENLNKAGRIVFEVVEGQK